MNKEKAKAKLIRGMISQGHCWLWAFARYKNGYGYMRFANPVSGTKYKIRPPKDNKFFRDEIPDSIKVAFVRDLIDKAIEQKFMDDDERWMKEHGHRKTQINHQTSKQQPKRKRS